MGKKIKIAMIGVGNCASALMQGIEYYKNNPSDKIGLTSRIMNGYDIADIECVAAFDIDKRKVDIPLSEAIYASPNCVDVISNEIDSKIIVSRGVVLDGVSSYLTNSDSPLNFLPIDNEGSKEEVIAELIKTKPDFIINYLPVGSIQASEFYAECALEADVSFINGMPVFIASNSEWQKRFSDKNLLLIGDDVKAQVGATILHRALVNTFSTRGATVSNTYQLNVGGNTDFLNMKDNTRLRLKKESKKQSIESVYKGKLDDLYAGPADLIEFLSDAKLAFMNISGFGFGGCPIDVELKVKVEDSPNSAGIMVDVLRSAKAILDGRIDKEVIDAICAYGFKHPPVQMTDAESFEKIFTVSS